jgi:hypothetical protein
MQNSKKMHLFNFIIYKSFICFVWRKKSILSIIDSIDRKINK